MTESIAQSPQQAEASKPVATYRLQFHRGFPLRRATELVPYLALLGVSHLYASPLLKAMPGSRHGYDVCDPGRINPELGTEKDLASLVETLHQFGMGLVLDIVPNHMGVGGPDNPWWWDVLKHGRQSRFAHFFDVEWDHPDPELRGKILAPVLGDDCEEVLSGGDLRLDTDGDEVVLRYFEHVFPLAPGSDALSAMGGSPANRREALQRINASPEKLGALLECQHYRLAHWRRGDSQLNYRRFFTIHSLAGVRVEDPEVFRMTHEHLLHWHGRGWIDGFRVDHPDGLRDPGGYLERLRGSAPSTWITIEKILEAEENLPPEWPVEGTTGYDFLNRANRLLVDGAGEAAMTEIYQEFTGQSGDFSSVAREAKREVLAGSLAAEVGQLLRILATLTNSETPDSFREDPWRDVLIELIACFPVYRTYLRSGGATVRDEDRRRIEEAVARVKCRPGCSAESIDAIARVLAGGSDGREADEFVARFQQLTGPAMAKGVEDCAFYRHNRLIALNEVGGDPAQFGATVEEFHRDCGRTVARWSASMLATSTHDTKRGEDVRARLCLLSEMPGLWAAAVRRWSALCERYREGQWPDRNAEYFFYQTLAGAWPLSLDRVWACMEKSAREAGQWTAWTRIDPAYEEALKRFVTGCLQDKRFTREIKAFALVLAGPGSINSLTLTLLKLTVPGVPDIYQGAELWDLSLVDPDNRRPVDFSLRERLIGEMEGLSPEQVWARRAEGLPKLWTICRTLAVRKSRPKSFDRAAYTPVRARGARADHAVAFLRSDDIFVIVPRLVWGLGLDWKDTNVDLPAGEWRNELTGDKVNGGNHQLAELLRRFPVALFVRQSSIP